MPIRKVPIDMAGFAVNLKLFLLKPWVKFGITTSGKKSKTGQLETNLLEHFITRDEIECRGSNSEVWREGGGGGGRRENGEGGKNGNPSYNSSEQ